MLLYPIGPGSSSGIMGFSDEYGKIMMKEDMNMKSVLHTNTTSSISPGTLYSSTRPRRPTQSRSMFGIIIHS